MDGGWLDDLRHAVIVVFAVGIYILVLVAGIALAILATDIPSARASGSFFHPGRYFPSEPTKEQIEACTDDAFRLCDNAFPDREAVKICMVRKRRLLSQMCRESFR